MKRRLTPALILIGALTLVGCAPRSNFPDVDERLARAEARKQRIVAMKSQLRHDKRIWNVASRILAANAALCGEKVMKHLGVKASTLEHYGTEWREIARTEFGVGAHLTINHVAEDSPAQVAGLGAGDMILRLDGETLGTGERAVQKIAAAMRRGDNRGADMTLKIKRRGEERSVIVKSVAACDYPVVLINKDVVNAWADGTKIYITTGMLRFIESDEELALIIGHELAHNTRGHIQSKLGNQLIGAIFGAIVTAYSGVDVVNLGTQAGRHAFSQEFEAEADYVGVYYAGRAGYDLTEAASFWRRLAASHPEAIHLAGSTHPSTAKRFLAIERAVAEFEHKRKNRLPLIPDERANP